MGIHLIKIDKMVMNANVLTRSHERTHTHTFCVLLIIQLIFPKANVCIIFEKTNESFQKTLGSPSLPSSLSLSLSVCDMRGYMSVSVLLFTHSIAQRINSWHLIHSIARCPLKMRLL